VTSLVADSAGLITLVIFMMSILLLQCGQSTCAIKSSFGFCFTLGIMYHLHVTVFLMLQHISVHIDRDLGYMAQSMVYVAFFQPHAEA